MQLLLDENVRRDLLAAWLESSPGISGGHEEGGFIVLGDDGTLNVVRWPKGAGNSIIVPDHSGGRIKEGTIIGSFHTHPNIGDDYLQEPSETDRRAVRDDPDFGAEYLGELVISAERIYLINPMGDVSEIGRTTKILK